ncbi:hypothetical protein DY124_00585 [Apilactobacillus micheneri]|uniref:hypothetical protein n=1 Tax=Apilactobacillus micheneri TaxID=1899430 RepID=UPI001125C9FF|nr:hypothetical protein [Apilactobacillus micheneri]TPR45484.1 hypothetical protein DY124_00585 [Apilactobacillus micheneri]TPR48930.1 hypothetical protein DY125_00585 [Apilactobacillus micheneri]
MKNNFIKLLIIIGVIIPLFSISYINSDASNTQISLLNSVSINQDVKKYKNPASNINELYDFFYANNKSIYNQEKQVVNNKLDEVLNYLNHFKFTQSRAQSILNEIGFNHSDVLKQKVNNYADLVNLVIKDLTDPSPVKLEPTNQVSSDKFSTKKWETGYINPDFAYKSLHVEAYDDGDYDWYNMNIPVYKSIYKLNHDDARYKNADSYIYSNKTKNKKSLGFINASKWKIKKYNSNIFMIKINNHVYYVPKKVKVLFFNRTVFEKYNTHIDKNGNALSLYSASENSLDKKVVINHDAKFPKNKILHWVGALGYKDYGNRYHSISKKDQFDWQIDGY